MHDPTVLRAIAHPVRNRILGELTAQGSLRAADIARELGIPANSASFHLRQLAKYGLVEEDPVAARDKRDRVWRATSPDGLTFSLRDIEETPGGKAASRVFRTQAATRAHGLVDAAYSDAREEGTHRSVMDHTVRLTDEEAAELATDITDLLDKWSIRARDDSPGRRTYSLFAVLQPLPPL